MIKPLQVCLATLHHHNTCATYRIHQSPVHSCTSACWTHLCCWVGCGTLNYIYSYALLCILDTLLTLTVSITWNLTTFVTLQLGLHSLNPHSAADDSGASPAFHQWQGYNIYMTAHTTRNTTIIRIYPDCEKDKKWPDSEYSCLIHPLEPPWQYYLTFV
jgi:hypothetical protein